MARKRPSLSDVADQVSRIGRPAEAPTEGEATPRAGVEPTSRPSAPVEAGPFWRKYTVPFCAAQIAKLDQVLTRLAAEHGVKVGMAEMARLALDGLLRRLEDDPDGVLVELHQQQQTEQAAAPGRKFAPSRGLGQYLRDRGLLE